STANQASTSTPRSRNCWPICRYCSTKPTEAPQGPWRTALVAVVLHGPTGRKGVTDEHTECGEPGDTQCEGRLRPLATRAEALGLDLPLPLDPRLPRFHDPAHPGLVGLLVHRLPTDRAQRDQLRWPRQLRQTRSEEH